LRIFGKRGSHNLFYVYINIRSPFLENSALIRFLVDTGAAMTSIGMMDSIRNGINIFDFEKGDIPATGIGGHLETYILPKCNLMFLTNENSDSIIHNEELDKVQMFHEPDIYQDDYIPVPSILGIDIIEKFKISFQKDLIILEK
jgi:hypothetical protein